MGRVAASLCEASDVASGARCVQIDSPSPNEARRHSFREHRLVLLEAVQQLLLILDQLVQCYFGAWVRLSRGFNIGLTGKIVEPGVWSRTSGSPFDHVQHGRQRHVMPLETSDFPPPPQPPSSWPRRAAARQPGRDARCRRMGAQRGSRVATTMLALRLWAKWSREPKYWWDDLFISWPPGVCSGHAPSLFGFPLALLRSSSWPHPTSSRTASPWAWAGTRGTWTRPSSRP